MNIRPTSRSLYLSTIGLSLWTCSLSAQEEAPPAEEQPAPLVADPARDLYEAAQLSYAEAQQTKKTAPRKIAYESSQRLFQRFLKAFPHDQRRNEAQFYIASCYQELDQPEEAFALFKKLANSDGQGIVIEAATQQVADAFYQQKKYQEAAPLFARLAQLTTQAKTRHLALFRHALCLQHLNQIDELKDALRAVVFDKGSPYQEKARIAIAALFVETGEKERALANYQLLTKSEDKQTAADAILQTALLTRELSPPGEATVWFEQVMTNKQLSQWHGKAQLTLMSEAYNAGDFARTTALYQRGKFKLPRDQDTQRIAMAAESYRQLGNDQTADRLYARLSKVSTDKNQAFDAAYAVLTRSYQKGEAKFIRAGEEFLRKYESTHNEDPRVDNVHLMLGEKYSSAKKYREAARQYGEINLRRLDASHIPRVRYRLAYARLKTQDLKGARDSFNVFLSKHPDDQNAVRALAHRASIHRTLGAQEAALSDYQKLLTLTKEANFRLQALSNIAEIHRKNENLPQLIATHHQLLEEFPDRPTRDQAATHFVLGWAHFKQNEFALALPQLITARELNPKGLGKDTTLHLALIHFARQDQAALQPELDKLVKEFPNSQIPRPVYAWLGATYAANKDFTQAWKYLPQAVTPNNPEDTKTAIWKAYAQSAEALQHHREALQACDILLPREGKPYLRAVLLHRKAKSLFGLKQYPGAREVAKEALTLKPQGQLNAELRLTLGDIAFTQNQLKEALSHYVVVAELIGTDETKATAVNKAITTYEQLGDPESLASAAEYRAQR